jgi:hypothetical protein
MRQQPSHTVAEIDRKELDPNAGRDLNPNAVRDRPEGVGSHRGLVADVGRNLLGRLQLMRNDTCDATRDATTINRRKIACNT